MLFICSDHVQELLKVIPRCLCVDFSESPMLFILISEFAVGTLFLNISREVVLLGLKSATLRLPSETLFVSLNSE